MNSPRILFIIDDDLDDREILVDVVKSIDEKIVLWESTDGEDALLKLNLAINHLPDVIFLDLNMPKVNGLECLRIIKNMEKVKHIPVHIYTTSSGHLEKEKCLKLGARGFITKTSRLSELRREVEGILQNSFYQSN